MTKTEDLSIALVSILKFRITQHNPQRSHMIRSHHQSDK